MAYRTILLKGELTQTEEAKAGVGSIYPGMLLAIYSNAGEVRLHTAAGQPAAPIFAKEDDLQGDEVGTAYTVSNRIQYLRCRPGDIIAGMIAQGEDINEGDYLCSHGDGCLAKWAAGTADEVEYPKSIVAVALEAINLSTSADANTLAKVMIV
jgi:hypothetical protein